MDGRGKQWEKEGNESPNIFDKFTPMRTTEGAGERRKKRLNKRRENRWRRRRKRWTERRKMWRKHAEKRKVYVQNRLY